MDKKQDENIEDKLKEEVEDLKKEDSEIAHLKEETKNWEDKYKRALADYQNLQRHSQEQRIVWAGQASREIILKLLPVLDTLVLTAKHFQDKSLQLAIDQFLSVLREDGVERIKTVGEKFNPHLMEAIGTTEGEDGKVIEESRMGFMLNESVLRTAQVIVGSEKSKVTNTPSGIPEGN